MSPKLIFLDIDGTLTMPGSNEPPQSALDAIRAAQKKGNLVFLCSGRNPGMLEPLLKKLREAFAPENDENVTEAAKEAVSDDMGAAMLNYMPLRGVLSFGGADSAPAIEQMLKALNNQ